MATLVVQQSLNMLAPGFFPGDASATLVAAGGSGVSVREADGTRVDLGGTLTVGNGLVTGGTVTSITEWLPDNAPIYQATGLDVDGAQLAADRSEGDGFGFVMHMMRGADSILGSGGADTLPGFDGNDTIFGGDGDDDLNGNLGTDIVLGERGADFVRGGQGTDLVFGNEGDDWHVNGNIGNDTVQGDGGRDTVFGGQGNDLIFGDFGNPTLIGDNDSILGNLGDDLILAEHGDDTVSGDDGNDQIAGGPGADIVFGGAGSDSLYGGQGDLGATSDPGADRLDGGADDDLLFGDRGDDTLTGGAGADRFDIFSGAGVDRITDFSLQDDVIALEVGLNGIDYSLSTTFASFAQRFSPDGAGGTRIDLGLDNALILEGIQPAQIAPNDFLVLFPP